MKRRTKRGLRLWLLALCALLLAGCGAAGPRAESSGGGGEEAVPGSFSPRDLEGFSLQSRAFTFPASSGDLLELGWVVLGEDCQVDEEDGYGVRSVLTLGHEGYPGVRLRLYSECWAEAFDPARSTDQALEESGVSGIEVRIDLDQVDREDAVYPSLRVGDIGLSATPEQVVQAFGEGYDPDRAAGGSYLYQTAETEGDGTRYYQLEFSFQDGKMCALRAGSSRWADAAGA